jgi:hypothetical protein
LLGENQLDSLTINRIIAALLKDKSSNVEPIQVSTNGLLCDGRGTPLLFALTKSVTYEQLRHEVADSGLRPFVVWSAGPNRTNEFGFGDDIFR